jgi:hypothetical protein
LLSAIPTFGALQQAAIVPLADDPDHIPRAWVVLRKSLGYTQFVAQEGDWGPIITDLMGVHAAPELLGNLHQHAWHLSSGR